MARHRLISGYGMSAPWTFHHHCWAYRAPIGLVALLGLMGAGAMISAPRLGLLVCFMAVVAAVGIRLHWSWHTLEVTESKLIRRHGMAGLQRDVISLFGQVSTYQTPVVGKWLDVGSIHLKAPGSDLTIRHIANFNSFYQQLVDSQRQGDSRDETRIRILIWAPQVNSHTLDGYGRSAHGWIEQARETRRPDHW